MCQLLVCESPGAGGGDWHQFSATFCHYITKHFPERLLLKVVDIRKISDHFGEANGDPNKEIRILKLFTQNELL